MAVLGAPTPSPPETRVFIFIFDDLGFLQNRRALSQQSSLAPQQPASGTCPGLRLRKPTLRYSLLKACSRPLQTANMAAREFSCPGKETVIGFTELVRSPGDMWSHLPGSSGIPSLASPARGHPSSPQCFTFQELVTCGGRGGGDHSSVRQLFGIDALSSDATQTRTHTELDEHESFFPCDRPLGFWK